MLKLLTVAKGHLRNTNFQFLSNFWDLTTNVLHHFIINVIFLNIKGVILRHFQCLRAHCSTNTTNKYFSKEI